MKATIINNEVFCGLCGKPTGNSSSYNQVEYNRESYTKFDRYCSNPRCNAISSYLLDLTIENEKRFVVNKNEVREIKDSKE